MEWHVVQTSQAAEGRAAIGVGGIGLEAYLPIQLERQNYRGRCEIAWRPLFQNYVFARADSGRDMPRLMAIAGVLRQNGKPARIADDVIATIRQAEQLGAFDRTRQARLLEGDTVAIRGAFGGLVDPVGQAASPVCAHPRTIGCPFR
jgi:hypothetical protein